MQVWNVAFMMLPLPIFWALFDQQGSRWTFQASRMDGAVGNLFTLQPDNIQVTWKTFQTESFPVRAGCERCADPADDPLV